MVVLSETLSFFHEKNNRHTRDMLDNSLRGSRNYRVLDDRALKKEKMASSSAEVPYNHPTENVLFGQNVIEKISDTCLGQVRPFASIFL